MLAIVCNKGWSWTQSGFILHWGIAAQRPNHRPFSCAVRAAKPSDPAFHRHGTSRPLTSSRLIGCIDSEIARVERGRVERGRVDRLLGRYTP